MKEGKESGMFNPVTLIRPQIQDMPAYEPILPFEVLSRQLGLLPEKIVKLDANENPYGPLPVVREALGRLPYAHIYPDPGSDDLRAALARYHNLPVGNILAGAGADELIDLVLRLVINPGDAIINCPPTFGMYAFDGDLNAARVIPVPRREDFSLDVDGIRRAAREHRPKVLFLASPNNPDGSLVPRETLQRLLELPLLLVLDEAYIEFSGTPSLVAQVPNHQNLIVLRTFSKWAGLAGLRVGFGLFPSALMPHLWKIKQPYNVSVAASTAAIVSLEHADDLLVTVKRMIAERERLFELLQSIPWLKPYPSRTNFILCRVEGRGAAQLKRDLAAQGILVRYFDRPGLENCIRISVGKPEHTDALLAALRELSAMKS
jgi:histidinol-phosphate aminotransferase